VAAFLFAHTSFIFRLRAFLAAALCGPRLGSFFWTGFFDFCVVAAWAFFLRQYIFMARLCARRSAAVLVLRFAGRTAFPAPPVLPVARPCDSALSS